MNFAGADLSNADLALSSFNNADFRGANLKGANFFQADFTDAQLDGADITGANLSRANLTAEQLAKTIGRPAEKLTFQPGPAFQACEAALRGQHHYIHFKVQAPDGLHHTTLNGFVPPQGVGAVSFWVHQSGGGTGHGSLTLNAPSLSDAFTLLLDYFGPQATVLPESFHSWQPKIVDAARDALCEAFGVTTPTPEERAAAQAIERQRRADLKKTMLAELRGGADGITSFSARPADDFRKMDHFPKADLRKAQLDGIKVMNGLIFNGAKFDEVSLVGANVDRADWKKTSFTRAFLRQSKIAANMSGASFNDATLEEIDFSGADLSKVDFAGATLTNCRFGGASLRGADLSKATIAGGDFKSAQYDEQTLFPPSLTTTEMTWVGHGLPPHELEAERRKVAAAVSSAQQATSSAAGVDDSARRTQRRDEFMAKVKQNVDKAKIDKALKMLKAERFELFVDVKEDHLVGVVKSQSDADLVYACRLAADGSYQCCTQNLNVCGGLRGSPCKHLLVLAIGIERNDAAAPETLGLWIASSRNRQTSLDKEKMGDVLLRYKSAQVGEVDWRPTETTPEDFYAF